MEGRTDEWMDYSPLTLNSEPVVVAVDTSTVIFAAAVPDAAANGHFDTKRCVPNFKIKLIL